VNVYPCPRPGESSALRLALCIEMAQHSGCFDKLAVLKDGPACGVAFLHQDVFLLQDGMSPDLIGMAPAKTGHEVTLKL
jgi:hypothetical protein